MPLTRASGEKLIFDEKAADVVWHSSKFVYIYYSERKSKYKRKFKQARHDDVIKKGDYLLDVTFFDK